MVFDESNAAMMEISAFFCIQAAGAIDIATKPNPLATSCYRPEALISESILL